VHIFVISPGLEPNTSFQQKRHTLIRCFVIIFWGYVAIFALSLIDYSLATAFDYESLIIETRSLYVTTMGTPLILSNLAFRIVIAPIGEELSFRSFLNFRKEYVAMSLSGLVFIIHRMAAFLFWRTTIGLAYSIGIAVLVFCLSYVLINDVFIAKLKKHSYLMLYGSNLLFVGLHLTNYRIQDFHFLNYLCIPIVLMPQILSSIVYSYLRIKNGLAWSIGLHAFENALVIIPFALRDYWS
jgi:hypothetical protein